MDEVNVLPMVSPNSTDQQTAIARQDMLQGASKGRQEEGCCMGGKKSEVKTLKKSALQMFSEEGN